MKKIFFRSLVLIVLVLPSFLTFLAHQNQIQSVPVKNLKDQLSSAQLSFFGRLSSYTGSLIRIDVGTSLPSEVTANLAAGDTLAVANSTGFPSIYTVKDVGDTATIEINPSVGTTTPNAYVVATRSAIHTVTFTPQSAISGEIWQFLVKASNRAGETPSDGMPDQGGFDLGGDQGAVTTGLGTKLKAADVTCPNGGVASVGTTVNITSGIDVGYTGSYHVVQCATAVGTSNSGTAISMVIGRVLTAGSQLINPSPSFYHVLGQASGSADTYVYAIRQLDKDSNLIDTTFGKIAVTESVRVTAIVDPTITLTIGTSNSTVVGTNRCGSPLGNGAPLSTPTAVSFGPLVLGTYNNLAQSLHCITNSQNGYVIQAFENRPMTMLGSTTTIPDTKCDGACSAVAATAWTTYSSSGFGYSLEVGTTSAGATLGITTTGQYKSFGVGNGNAQTIMSRTNNPSATDSVYICYRATASTFQPAGTYENSISFIATATF